MENNEILKVKEVAEMLQLSPSQVLNLIKDGAEAPMPHIRINGRSPRFRKSDVMAWFTKNLVNAV